MVKGEDEDEWLNFDAEKEWEKQVSENVLSHIDWSENMRHNITSEHMRKFTDHLMMFVIKILAENGPQIDPRITTGLNENDETTCRIHNFVTGASQVCKGQRFTIAVDILKVIMSYPFRALK